MKIRTSELTGAALDWAVANCEGYSAEQDSDIIYCDSAALDYSTDWSQGGPIIEKMFSQGLSMSTAEFAIGVRNKNLVMASLDGDVHAGFYYGPTPLIAAMRCYVASNLGDEVDVPKELE